MDVPPSPTGDVSLAGRHERAFARRFPRRKESGANRRRFALHISRGIVSVAGAPSDRGKRYDAASERRNIYEKVTRRTFKIPFLFLSLPFLSLHFPSFSLSFFRVVLSIFTSFHNRTCGSPFLLLLAFSRAIVDVFIRGRARQPTSDDSEGKKGEGSVFQTGTNRRPGICSHAATRPDLLADRPYVRTYPAGEC